MLLLQRAKAGVSGQLFIYGAAPGTAKITAKSANGTALATVSVTVSAPECCPLCVHNTEYYHSRLHPSI